MSVSPTKLAALAGNFLHVHSPTSGPKKGADEKVQSLSQRVYSYVRDFMNSVVRLLVGYSKKSRRECIEFLRTETSQLANRFSWMCLDLDPANCNKGATSADAWKVILTETHEDVKTRFSILFDKINKKSALGDAELVAACKEYRDTRKSVILTLVKLKPRQDF